ncbi:MAG TPA: sugar ABC transporter permease [Tepidisphaeraceae bacterium]|nr:sugar ABC transporter permease [Tepidisphaeraceae bacterium]
MTQTTTTPLSGPASSHATGATALIAPGLGYARGRQTLARRCADSLALYAILAPAFILLAIFSLVPFVIAISTSFFDYEVGGDATFIGLSNYLEYFHDYTFWKSFGNMFFLTGFHVVAVMIVPLAVAKLIFSLSSERASYLYRILFLFPIVVPNVALYLIWRGVMYNENGLVDRVVTTLGFSLPAQGWLSGPDTVLWAIAFIGFPFAGGINVLIYYAGLTSIPDSVHEAATIDGATGLRKFLLIDVPLVLSQMKLLVMLTIIGGIQAFEGIYILTNGQPGFESMVPGLWMYQNAFLFQRMGYACAIGVILFLLILALTVINLRYFRTSEQLQGDT